ncbi:MAG: ABC transporter substrate-binding protein, partial [Thermodesulfobacteriota bacterium]
MKKRILKKVMIGFSALMGWMVFQGGLGRSQAEEIKVGVISTASGNLADLGGEERKGITMATEEFNARGGVLGKKIRLYVEDDESDPSVAARKARRLIEGDNVDFLVGVVSSSSAIAVGEVAERYGKVYICTNANSDEITAA